MKINVTENKVSIKEEQILNENEYNIHRIQFDFSSEYTDDLVKIALFSIDNHTYKKIISNNECDIPPEVLTQRGYSILGVYAYKAEQDTLVLRYSPSPTRISVYDGSYQADAENSEPITPSEIEQYQQILQNSLQQFQNQYNALVEETEGDIQAIEDELQRKVDEGYFDGKDATINGKNSIEIEAGNNITIDNTENGIRINSTGGSSGTSNYNELTNKPKINNVELSGNKSLNNLGIQPAGNYALESDIPDVSDFITRDVNDLTYYYTKTEVDGKVSAVYKYKGTVETYSDLPSTGLTVGDVYNVETDGSNYAWTGSAWDKLGGDVDLSGYQTKITSSNKLSADLISDGTTNKTVTNTEKNTWNNKQNAISDLSTIRSGASAGATAVQPNDLATVATSGSYNDLSNKPTIPSEVTESIVAGWGFTKNTGTYSKPSGGIPKTDLASAVQTSLGKADTALQSHQDISGKEDKTNKVTSISSSSTDTQYPSAKCVYDLIGDVETILTTLTTGSGV